MEINTTIDTACSHCGTEIIQPDFVLGEKQFCCAGCKSVYQILSANNLCNYYAYNDTPGQSQKKNIGHFEYLDADAVISQLIDFKNENLLTVSFYIPSIHCSSCLWLLENLYKLNPAVVSSRIDFLKKQVAITLKHNELSLRGLVELLASIGYEPLISLQDVVKEKGDVESRDLIIRIAVAGLCMGNVMLFSFPEYFGLNAFEQQFKSLFGYLNLVFSLPVVFYCAKEFFQSAWGGIKSKHINLDAPLAVIIAVLFLRSAFEILTQTGPGFSDTLTGLVFLLLIGRWLKLRTYKHFSFERDYKSYFPIAVTVLRDSEKKILALNELSVGDRLFIRNSEIVPADAILMKGDGYFDFSFVTGEAQPVHKVLGEIVYAGGRQIGGAIELEIIKPVSQSYLTRLWNNDTFKINDSKIRNFNDTIAQYFSLAAFFIAFAAAGYWLLNADSVKAWSAFTAVLIVVCPCVLSLSTPFTLSAVLKIFDNNQFYLKNTDAVEQLARIDTIVFDKTGTITSPDAAKLNFNGTLTPKEKNLIASLACNSAHPLSREIVMQLKANTIYGVCEFKEIPGKGISGIVQNHVVRLGNDLFINSERDNADKKTTVYAEIDGRFVSGFSIRNEWRPQLKSLFQSLCTKFDLHLISGDQETDRESLAGVFTSPKQMHFRQTPQKKLEYIKHLQASGKKVMMVGDGLNDAGALKQSDLGVAVTDNINNFSPACDAILHGDSLNKIKQFIHQSKDAVRTVKVSFVIASLYNLCGVWFAVQGALSPLTAAVLMPISTITIISFTSACTHYYAGKNRLK